MSASASRNGMPNNVPPTRTDRQTLQRAIDAPIHIFKNPDYPPHLFKIKTARNTSQLLTLFYFADKQLASKVNILKLVHQSLHFTSPNKVVAIHAAQKLLLEALYYLYLEADETIKSSRSHRDMLPSEDRIELSNGFSENVLYAGQALARGYRIRGIESYTEELRTPAIRLIHNFQNLRISFRQRCFSNPLPPYRDLDPILKEFDRAWMTFEHALCACYFSRAYYGVPHCMDEIDLFQASPVNLFTCRYS